MKGGTLALLPIRAGFRVSWSAWQKAPYSHTAPQPQIFSVSGNKLPLSHFKLGVRASLSSISSGQTWNQHRGTTTS
jgi:hypothetical protein